ncbi:MAG: hydroxymethylbilane synthase [Phycisphaerales bacterium]|nr:hydroxymethylbilane synthase [Phycisphaerales bacterium]
MRTALILAAHGSGDGSAANQLVRSLAQQLDSDELFHEVKAAFNLGAPKFADALNDIRSDRVVIVPVMTSDGYFRDVILPRELARSRRFADVELHLTAPVGTHAGVADILARRAEDALGMFELDRHDTAVIIVGHGTERHGRSRAATISWRDVLEDKSIFARVEAAFLDESPRVEDLTDLAEKNLVVIPFLIGGGHHATRDIPVRMGLEPSADGALPLAGSVDGRFVVCTDALGGDSALVGVIRDLATNLPQPVVGKKKRRTDQPQRLLKRRVLRLGSRRSALALWQARYVAEQLLELGCNVEVVEIDTSGDRDLNRPIHELGSSAPFSDDIEQALLENEIDLAVHSLKDLAVKSPDGLTVAAVLKRGDARETLVSRENAKLIELPVGAVIGTSSPRRAAQIRRFRPDLRVAPIRGPVEDRVRQVRRGDFDAAVLAAAGLERLGLSHEAAEMFSLDEFVPAPAQAALAVQTRAGDDEILSQFKSLDHLSTRRAVTAELEFLRPFESRIDVVAAAYGTSQAVIRLHSRLLTSTGELLWDMILEGEDPNKLAAVALKKAMTSAHSFLEVGS